MSNGIKTIFSCFILLVCQTNCHRSEPPTSNQPLKPAVNQSAPTLFMKDGGWCWYQDPRAVIINGKLIIGGVSGTSGDVRVGVYDLEQERIQGTVVLHPNLEVDDHDAPALYVRSDGSLLAMWARHGNEKIHYYDLSATQDYLTWTGRKQFYHSYQEDHGVTYMNLYHNEDNDVLYNFYRDGPTFNPAFITSIDEGLTWGNRTHFIANDIPGRQRPYVRYLQKDKNTIGFSYTDGHPRNYGNSIYYAEFRDGRFFKVDGSLIRDLDQGPLRTSEGEKIYVGSEVAEKPENYESVPNSAWTCAMGKDGLSHPYVGYTVYLTDEDHRFRVSFWDGSNWQDQEIAYAGKCLYPEESSYTGLMAFDPLEPQRVYISTDVDPSTGRDLGGTHEIYAAQIKAEDEPSSIGWEPLTQQSPHRNIRPLVVAGEGYKVLLWLRGPWRTYRDYESDVVGIILERPKIG